MPGLSLLGLLAACTITITTTSAGPTYWGETREKVRLEAIASRPSEVGTEEAVAMWARHSDWPEARSAVLGAIPSFTGPLEAEFTTLSVEQQREAIAQAGSFTGNTASALVLRLSVASGLVDDAMAALAGKQDPEAVQGLIDLARAGSEPTRVAALRAMEPAGTPLARTALLEFARGPGPSAIRTAAIDVLTPSQLSEVRMGLLAWASTEDSDVAAYAFTQFFAPTDPSEIAAGIAGTGLAAPGAAAVRFLDGTPGPLADTVLARFVALVDPATPPADGPRRTARFEAAHALLRRGDDRGGPALVQLLGDASLRARSLEVLDAWLITSVPPLRAHAGGLSDPTGRAEAARLLARYGGPEDAALVGELADPSERDALVAALPRAPYGLFPTGRVRYAPAVSDGAIVERSLLEVIAEGRTQRAFVGDPVLAYVGAARAYLAGARSGPDKVALDKAAALAQQSLALWVDGRLDTRGTRHASAIPPLAGALAGKALGLSVRSDARAPLLPALAVTGKLACTEANRVEKETLTATTYNYTVTVPNPRKAEFKQAVASYEPKTITSCTLVCNCMNVGKLNTSESFACGTSPTLYGDSCGCAEVYTTSENPDYRALITAYENEPELADVRLSVPRERERVTETYTETCEGPLGVAIGAATFSGPLSYAAERRDSVVNERAWPRKPDGTALPEFTDSVDRTSFDNRPERLEAAVSRALTGYAPALDDVRRMYAAAIGPAVAKTELRSARDALVWSEPALFGTDATSLDRFREVLFSDGDKGFPAAWR